MIVNNKFLIFPLLASYFLLACDPGAPSGPDEFSATGYAQPLSQQEFNQLAPEQQYEVANKLYGTMFRGINPEDFFDTSAGILNLVPASKTFLVDTKKQLSIEMAVADIIALNKDIDGLDEQGIPVEADAKYTFDNMSEDSVRPMQRPLAYIKEDPISKDLLVQWMAYFLSNTIMFSPATEMDAPNSIDANNMYFFLTNHLQNESSVRDIIRANLSTLARWRVSRSAENHALEAFELYLGKFNNTEKDEQNTYRGGVACQQYYLTSEADGYLLSFTGTFNAVPQLVLDNNYVTTCEDLYGVIAGHELLMPRVNEVIINYLMSGRSLEDRLKMNAAIVQSGAETFRDIFTAILYSREYLLNTERPKSFEENLIPLLDKLKWNPRNNQDPVDKKIFENMTESSGSIRLYMGAMGWDAMTYKIGRIPDVPVDFKSFANYHKSIREDFLKKTVSYSGGKNDNSGLFYDENGDVRPFIGKLSVDGYINYLFLATLYRKPSTVEIEDLTAVYKLRNHLQLTAGVFIIKPDKYDEMAEITFDYISRLPEFYYFRAIN